MPRELIAVVDLETTGLDETKDRVIEAAWALVDVETAQVVELHSELYHSDANEAEAINGIPAELVRSRAKAEAAVILPAEVTSIVAHNAAFDSRWGVYLPTKGPCPWLCTFEDWRWPRCSGGSQLAAIALAHGVGLVSAHRAYTDVITLCSVLEMVHQRWTPLREQLAYARRPRSTFVSLAPFEAKDTVKAHGFRWVPERKEWRRRMLPEDAASLPFKVRQVDA